MVTIDFAFGTCTFKKYPKLSRVYSSCPLSLQLSWQESTRKSRNSTAYLWSCGKCCLPMLSMAFLGFPNTCTILTNTYQYIFSFLGPLSQRDPTLPSKALLKPLTGIWNHSQCILGIKKWSAWKVTYLLYIFFIYVVVSSNQAKWHSELPSASWYLPNPKFTGMVA